MTQKLSNEIDLTAQDRTESTNTDVNSERRKFMHLAAGSGAMGVLAMSGIAKANAAAVSGTVDAKYQKLFSVDSYASFSADSPLKPFKFDRRAVGPNDVVIDIQYCGVCHSDIHTAHGDWGPQKYPLVTGHEIAGIVTAVGSSVSNVKIGDHVGVGCMVNSCGVCAECNHGFEQYCEAGPTMTYGTPVSKDIEPTGLTQGGYSTGVVVDKDFIIQIPSEYDLAAAGPVMCAGVTVYSPFKHWNIRKGANVGVVGLGGLGHLAVKIATAMGANVTVFTSSASKADDAKRFGAKDVIVNYDKTKMTANSRHFDFILDTVPVKHDLNPLIGTLKSNATLCLVGIGNVYNPNQLGVFSLISKRNSFAGSMIGGIQETQDVINFCHNHGIKPEYQLIKPATINESWENVVSKKVRYRYVMDMKSM